MKEFVYNGKPQDIKRVITESFPQLGYNAVNKILRNKDVKINGKKTGAGYVVQDGDKVAVYFPVKYYDTVYSDENILVVNKNIGIEVEGADSLVSILKNEIPDIRAVHRIDRNTRGLVVFALNSDAENELATAFKNRTVDKYYTARVRGVPKEKHAVLTAYLSKNAEKSEVAVFDNERTGTRKIITEYRVLEEGADESVLEVRLITGATHQIRAHLAHIGHPLIGDNKYGDTAFNKKKGRRYQELTANKIVFHFDSRKLKYLDKLIIKL